MRSKIVILTLTMAGAWAGCGGEAKKDKDGGDGDQLPLDPVFSFSDVQFQGASAASDEAIQARIDQSNAFHFALTKAIGATDDNVVTSAFSVQAAFALLYPATIADSASAQEL